METLGKDCVGHAVALQLEANGHDLSRTLGWTSYLFSTGSRSFADQQEQDRVVKRAVEILEQTVKYTWEKEKMYQAAEEKARLPSRIIVENIAADAGIGELVALFGGFHIQEVRILNEREPIKRTRVAHIDMHSVQAAKEALLMIKYIFGLRVYIRRAVGV
ncbi:hypothetical protein K469DRAFT_599154 [Zopfia rhizophila CBS 207.26]|uniref:RRM domain-containing protein n=1 Tax=Zopfia rhizophila CBS 207.26 TaxID=1314779 RepID=A0A6A6DJE2_9PEZI|nr:hypothetical protein K469DRAFT_599154 [Zopfia rhizophila CBS 207.26]